MIPLSSSDPPNLHAELGLDDSAQRLLWPGTVEELRRRGFEPQGQIAQGATSVVISCKERSTGRTLVVKVCYDPTNSVALELFQRERQILAGDHALGDLLPHYYGGIDQAGPQSPGTESSQPFLLLESIPGRRICDYIAESRDFPLPHRVRLCAVLARAVQRMHDANLVHGDISSNNVLVCKGDRIRLIDVGQGGRLTRGYRSVHSVSGQAGTGGFSPASLLAREVRPSQATDLRQCAAVVFHALTGQLAGSEPESKGARRQNAVLKAHKIPRALVKIVMRGLRDRDPHLSEEKSDPRLYASAEDLANDLDRWSAAKQPPRRSGFERMIRAFIVMGCAGFLLRLVASEWAQYGRPDLGPQVAVLMSRCAALPNREHPAVAALLRQEADLNRLEGNRLWFLGGEFHQTNTEARVRLLEQALEKGSELAWMAPLRENLTYVLTQSPWIESAPTIARAVAKLRDDSEQLRRLLERGETKPVGAQLIEFHRRLAEATRHNTDARPVHDQRRALETVLSRLPPRLAQTPERETFQERQGVAERAWTAGDWTVALQLFGKLHQDLDHWLLRELTFEEQQAVREASIAAQEKVQQELVQAREQSCQLEDRVLSLKGQIQELTAAGLEKQRELEQRLMQAETARRETERNDTSQREELTRLRADLKSAQETLQAESRRLEVANRSLAEWKRHAAESDRLLQLWNGQKSSEPPAGDGPPCQPPALLTEGSVEGERLVLPWGQVALAFRWCPPGEFRMGSPATEPGHESSEDQVDVTLTSGFWMLETEVTQLLWVAVMGQERRPNWEEQHGLGDNYPAYRIRWDEVQQFCVQLTDSLREQGRLPRGWRLELPTEAQWEYACRAGGNGRFCFGDNEEDLQRFAWYSDNAGGTNHPVATREPNHWGLYDLHGSVWEWTQESYDKQLAGGIDPRGAIEGTSRSRRGGSWINSLASCRSATRSGFAPRWSDYLGFRPCLVAAPESMTAESNAVELNAVESTTPEPTAAKSSGASSSAASPTAAESTRSPAPVPTSPVPDSPRQDSTAPAGPDPAHMPNASRPPEPNEIAPIPIGPMPPGSNLQLTSPESRPRPPLTAIFPARGSPSEARPGASFPVQQPTPAIDMRTYAPVGFTQRRDEPASPAKTRIEPSTHDVVWGGAWLLFLVWALLNHSWIVADQSGLSRVGIRGRKVRLLKWKDVRSWRVESYESSRSTETGQAVWMSRLVVKLKNAPPLVVPETWFASVVKELRLAVPELHASYAPPCGREPERMEVVFPSDEK
jgi:formylglycine-generating enzyme required for sulfatase activity/serine/threonine protein kinase